MKATHCPKFACGIRPDLWTPIFVGSSSVVVAYALWPRNKAALRRSRPNMPLRED